MYKNLKKRIIGSLVFLPVTLTIFRLVWHIEYWGEIVQHLKEQKKRKGLFRLPFLTGAVEVIYYQL